MKFKPGQRVKLVDADGRFVLARPYFYTLGMNSGILVDLHVDESGKPIDVVDAAKGVYRLGDRLLTIVHPESKSTEEASRLADSPG